MIRTITSDPASMILARRAGFAPGQAPAAGSLLHAALLLAQAETGLAFPSPARLHDAVNDLLLSLKQTRQLLAGTRHVDHGYEFSVVDGEGKAVELPEDGRLFAHLADTGGEAWSAFFNGLLRRGPSGVWCVGLAALEADSLRLVGAYGQVQPEAADGAADPSLVEYCRPQPDREAGRKGGAKLDVVLGLDRPVPRVVDLKTSCTRTEPKSLSEWRKGVGAEEAGKLDRDAQLLADDYQRPVRRGILFLSARTGRGTWLPDPTEVHPRSRPDDADTNVVRRRVWLRDQDQDWLEEFTATWADPSLFEQD